MSRHPKHILKKLLLPLALCCLLPLFSLEPKGGRPIKVVRVGMVEEPGFIDFLGNGRLSGYGYEYLQDIAFRSGWDIHYINGPVLDIVRKFEAGEIDLLMGMTKTEERERTMLYSTFPQGSRNYYIYTHPYGSGRIERGNAKSVNNARIGIAEKRYARRILEDWSRENGVSPVIVEGDADKLWKELADGQLDGIVAHDLRINSQEVPMFLLDSTDFFFTVSKKRPDLLTDVNSAQEKLLETHPFYNESLKQRFFTAGTNRQELSPEERTWVRSRGRIRVGYLEGFLPVSATVRGKAEGVYSLIVQVLVSNFGLEIESVPYSSEDKMISALKNMEVDAIFPYIFSFALADEDDFVLSAGATRIPVVTIHRSDFSGPVNTVTALRSGGLMKLACRLSFPEADVMEFNSLKDCLKAINGHKADLLMVSNYRLSRLSKDFYAFPDLEMQPNRETFDLCFAVGRDKPILMEVLSKAIAAINAGESDAILFSTMRYAYSFSLGEFVYDNAIPLLLCIIAVILVSVLLLRRRLRLELERKKVLEMTNAELEKTKDALEISSTAAQQASRAKSEFLSKMSHDIRTPLNAIIGFSNLILADNDGQEKVKDQVGKIRLSADHLLTLVNDVLDVSKIESGAMTLTPVDFRLSELVASVEHIIRPLTEGKKQTFTVELDEDGDFFADNGRIRQILLNLLSNAVKYTGTGGRVLLRVSNAPSPAPQRRNVSFVVADNGRGISDEYMKKLFTPFSREQRPEESAEVGTGLGMPIVKNLSNLMGGTVGVESQIHKGTTFTIRLPLLISLSEDAKAGGRAEASGGISGGQASKYLSGLQKPLQDLRILAAEDNELNTEILSAYLSINGAALTVAGNGRELLDIFEKSEEGSFDVILMDIQMPVMDGLEATRILRALDRPDARSIPVIAMSANAFNDDVAASLEAGMNAHIAKPIEISALIHALEEAKAHAGRQAQQKNNSHSGNGAVDNPAGRE